MRNKRLKQQLELRWQLRWCLLQPRQWHTDNCQDACAHRHHPSSVFRTTLTAVDAKGDASSFSIHGVDRLIGSYPRAESTILPFPLKENSFPFVLIVKFYFTEKKWKTKSLPMLATMGSWEQAKSVNVEQICMNVDGSVHIYMHQYRCVEQNHNV